MRVRQLKKGGRSGVVRSWRTDEPKESGKEEGVSTKREFDSDDRANVLVNPRQARPWITPGKLHSACDAISGRLAQWLAPLQHGRASRRESGHSIDCHHEVLVIWRGVYADKHHRWGWCVREIAGCGREGSVIEPAT
jgi:hypothetical protein